MEKYRDRLETITQKRCIPVWHKSRGLEYWKQMCKDYKYVAIGTTPLGLKSDNTTREELLTIIPTFLNIARERGSKVHGLGFTNMKGLMQYPFYSVDSTAWLYGNRGGFLYRFTGAGIDKISPKDRRLRGREGAIHNFCEWLKFSEFAEHRL